MKNLNENIFPPVPREFSDRVKSVLEQLPENKEVNMNKKFLRKGLLVAAALTIVLGTSAFAVNKIYSRVSHSSNIPIYTEYPEESDIENDFGFKAKLPEKFENGFVFNQAVKGGSESYDEEGNKVFESIVLNGEYIKGDEKLSLSVEESGSLFGDEGSEAYTYNGIDIFATEQVYKFCPPDYVLTEQDKEDEASGKYVFSYGSEKIETNDIVSAYWLDEGVEYCLLGIDISLTSEDMVTMAQEIINMK